MKQLKNQIPVFIHILILTFTLLAPFLAMTASAVGKNNLAAALITITGVSGLMYIFSL